MIRLKTESKEEAIWVLWRLTILATIVIGLTVRYKTAGAVFFFEGTQMSKLPLPTEFAVVVGPHMWVAAILLGIAVGVFLRVKGANEIGHVALVCHWLIFLGLYAFVNYGLWMPFRIIQEKLVCGLM